MKASRTWWAAIGSALALLVLLILASASLAQTPGDDPAANGPIRPQDGLALAATVTSTISYQGTLTQNGTSANGAFTMRFRLYDAATGGTLIWDSGDMNVTVSDGLFDVGLAVDQADFNGQALWLGVTVEGDVISPRQALRPAPYALSLRPGADVSGEPPSWSDAVLGVELTGTWPAGKAVAAYALATGTAIYGEARGGSGVYGYSADTYAVWGSSADSWGGFFTSNTGYGIRVDTGGTDHWDHGGYFTSVGGYGVYAQSTQNMGVRGEAGNVSGFSQPIGPVGVVGIGQSRGAYGSSGNGSGVYGISDGNYGVWGQSDTYRGVTGRTDRVDNNYGLYTPDNLYSFNYNLAGAIMHVVQNGGDEALRPGEVAVFSGMSQPLALGGPSVAQVARATTANSTAVAGVVYSRFNVAAVDPAQEHPGEGGTDPDLEVTPAGPVAPGEYLLLVVQGPAQVKASASSGAIIPGALMATSGRAGSAALATQVNIEGVKTALPGTVLGKALEPLEVGQEGLIYVFVTLD